MLMTHLSKKHLFESISEISVAFTEMYKSIYVPIYVPFA